MQFTIEQTMDLSAMMRRLGEDVAGGKRAGMITVLEEVRAKAAPHVPIRTSNLANSGTTEVSADGTEGVLRYTAAYGEFVHEGTGLFGPKKQKITPKNKKALYWSGAAHPVKSVKGMKPRPFLDQGLAETNIQSEFETGLQNYLNKKGW